MNNNLIPDKKLGMDQSVRPRKTMFVYFSFFTINMYSINIWLVVYLPL